MGRDIWGFWTLVRSVQSWESAVEAISLVTAFAVLASASVCVRAVQYEEPRYSWVLSEGGGPVNGYSSMGAAMAAGLAASAAYSAARGGTCVLGTMDPVGFPTWNQHVVLASVPGATGPCADVTVETYCPTPGAGLDHGLRMCVLGDSAAVLSKQCVGTCPPNTKADAGKPGKRGNVQQASNGD
jgi:hypothetical protein